MDCGADLPRAPEHPMVGLAYVVVTALVGGLTFSFDLPEIGWALLAIAAVQGGVVAWKVRRRGRPGSGADQARTAGQS